MCIWKSYLINILLMYTKKGTCYLKDNLLFLIQAAKWWLMDFPPLIRGDTIFTSNIIKSLESTFISLLVFLNISVSLQLAIQALVIFQFRPFSFSYPTLYMVLYYPPYFYNILRDPHRTGRHFSLKEVIAERKRKIYLKSQFISNSDC